MGGFKNVTDNTVPLCSILAHHAARRPGRLALIMDDLRLTYAELDARSTKRARFMQARGVGQDDYVTVALPNGLDFYETIFGIWKLGATPNVVSARLAPVELEHILGLVGPRLFVGQCPREDIPTVDGAFEGYQALSAEPLPPAIAKNWKAMTSGGSTGRPKVIVDAMPAQWDTTEGFLHQQPGEVVLNPGPLYHNAPFHCITMAIFTGNTIVEMQKFDAQRALDLIEEHGVNWVTMVPTMMHRIWQLGPEVLGRYKLPTLRMMLHMAAPCAPWLKEAWIDWLGSDRVWEYYGTTEATGSTIISGTDWLQRKGSVGKVRPGYDLKILDADGRECAVGEVGEVFFRPETGPSSTYHYLGSDSRLVGEYETMGDLGSVDGEGYLYLSDRRNDLIISGGANIYPAEVEAALEAHPEVRGSAVIGLPHDEWGSVVHAIVQPMDGSTLSEEALMQFVGQTLSRYKMPKRIEFTSEALRDEAGKVRRAALRQARLPQ